MSEKHKIAQAIDDLRELVVMLDFGPSNSIHQQTDKAHSAVLVLNGLFICEKCLGDGEELNSVDCLECGGTGIKPDILYRLEAEEVTENTKLKI